MANGFLTSPEFRGNTVRALYGRQAAAPPFVPSLLDRMTEPTDDEVKGWVDSGLDYLKLVQALAASPEYFSNG